MKLQDLRYVVALADHGHFGRAASACHIGQSTLSTQIKKLEQELGVVLFERTTQSVSVTPLGAEVARRARQILSEVDAIFTLGQRSSGPLAGDFKLGVIPTLGPYLLPWLVPALREDFPSLRLTVYEDMTSHLLEKLALHRLDAAFAALPLSDDRLETRALFDEPFWFAEQKGRQPSVGKVMKSEDLKGQRLLLLSEGNCLRDQALAICGTGDRDLDGDFRATSLETILQMVATGLGSTLLPAMACSEAGVRGLSTRPLEAGVGRRIGLAWRRSHPNPGDMNLLAETLLKNLPRCVIRIG